MHDLRFRRSPASQALARAAGLAALLSGTSALAQGAEDEARKAFTDGQAAEARGEASAACRLYRSSLQHLRAPGTLQRVARCDASDGHHRDAIAKLDEALGLLSADNAEDRTSYEAERAASKGQLARVAIATSPGAHVGVVTVDGVPTAPRGEPYELDPGRHVVLVDGASRTVTLKPGDNTALGVPFASQPGEPHGSPPADAASAPSSGSSGWLTAALVSFGVAGAAGIATAVTSVMALSSDAAAEDACAASDQAACDAAIEDANALLVPNLALWIVSGVAVGAGVTFLILDASSDDGAVGGTGRSTSRSARLQLRVGPTAVQASGRF